MDLGTVVALGVVAVAGIVYWVHVVSYYRGWGDGYASFRAENEQR